MSADIIGEKEITTEQQAQLADWAARDERHWEERKTRSERIGCTHDDDREYTVIREFVSHYRRSLPDNMKSEGATCYIRTNNYGSRLQFINFLVEVAREDFPHLKDEDIEIVHFGGQRYKYTFGIKFSIPNDPPKNYCPIRNAEQIL